MPIWSGGERFSTSPAIKYRLVARVNYVTQIVFVLRLLTHSE
jgi:mRNA-degrading endonuclease HigB of HigAB toxin-antitoxin module